MCAQINQNCCQKWFQGGPDVLGHTRGFLTRACDLQLYSFIEQTGILHMPRTWRVATGSHIKISRVYIKSAIFCYPNMPH